MNRICFALLIITFSLKCLSAEVSPLPDIDFSHPELIVINKTSDQALKALQEHKTEDAKVISFNGTATQTDFDIVVKNNPWIKKIGMMAWNEKIRNIDAISNLKLLQSLNIWIKTPENSPLDLTPVENLTNLVELRISNTNIKNINALSKLTRLESAEFFKSEANSIDFFEKTPFVKNVLLWGNHTFKSFKPLTTLKLLESLNIQNNPKATDHDLAELQVINTLKYFVMTDSKDVTNLNFLKNNEYLIQINADRCTNLKDISALKNMQFLERLSLAGTAITSLDALKGKNQLISLSIEGTKVLDIKILSSLEKLEYLDINKTEIADITPLLNSKTLRSITINKNVPKEQIDKLKKAIPNLIIDTKSYH